MIIEKFDSEFRNSITPEEEYIKFFSNIPQDEVIDIKKMTTADKVNFIEYCLDKRCINFSVLLNIVMLLKGCAVEEECFEEERVFFNDFEEYIDIKLELKDKIQVLSDTLVTYFIGAVKGYYNAIECEKIVLGDFEFALMNALDLLTISKMMRKSTVNVADCKPVEDCEFLISHLLQFPSESILSFE